MSETNSAVPGEVIEKRIFFLRGQKVMLSRDLASLYEVEPKVLIQAVKRNIERFPADFMFQLTDQEVGNLKSQFVTSSWGGSRSNPYAFTEQGIAMLSSVLRGRKAILVHIEIIRAFVRLRQWLSSHKDLARKLEELESKYDSQFKVVFDAIRALMAPPSSKQRKIGFHASD
jgi:ORF6N domain-containing protein